MIFLVHEGQDTTGRMGWYESDVDIFPGNIICPGVSQKTFIVENRAVNHSDDGEDPIEQIWLFCTSCTLPADAPGVIHLTVSDRLNR